MNTPPCFSQDQWVEWIVLARRSCTPLKNYCVDCTPEYRAQMTQEGKCVHPETIFVVDKEGEMSGVSSASKSFHGIKRLIDGSKGYRAVGFTIIEAPHEENRLLP